MDEFDLICWENMLNPPSKRRLENFRALLKYYNFPSSVVDESISPTQWKSLYIFLNRNDTDENLILSVFPTQMVTSMQYKDYTLEDNVSQFPNHLRACHYCSRLHCEEISKYNPKIEDTTLRRKTVITTFGILEFLHKRTSYCYFCNSRLFNVIEQTFYKF